MSKKINYIRPPKTMRNLLSDFGGVSEDFYSTSVPVHFAIMQENLAEKNGVLVQSLRVKKVDGLECIVDKGALKLFASHYNKGEENLPPTLILGASSKVWVVKNDGASYSAVSHEHVILHDSYMEFELDGVSNTIMADSLGNLVSYDGNAFTTHAIGHNFAILCNHNMRAFACCQGENTLHFSDDFNPYNWQTSIDAGGYINLPAENGAITDIVSVNQSLIVVQERGISKVTAFTDQSEFTVKNINIENDIIGGSVVSAVDRVVYCSSMGLGLFDGYESRIYCRELSSKLSGKTISGTYLDGKCYYNIYDNSPAKMSVEILVVDVSTMKYHYISHESGDKIVGVRSGGDKCVLTYYGSDDYLDLADNRLCILADDTAPSSMIWRSGEIDFGKSGVYKVIKNIVFGGESKIAFRIICDGDGYSYTVGEERRVLINLKGKEFQFELKPQGHKIKVPSPIIEYQVLDNI